LQAERDALAEQLAVLEQERDSLTEQLSVSKAEREQAQDDALSERLSTLESRLDHAVDLLGGLGNDRDAVDELEKRLAAAVAINAAAKRSVATLEQQLADRTRAYEELLEHLHTQRPKSEPAQSGPHFLFVTLDGRYELVEQDGPLPKPGDSVEVGGKQHTVSRVARTPGGDRPTVYTTPD
jgi:hypothetical protein